MNEVLEKRVYFPDFRIYNNHDVIIKLASPTNYGSVSTNGGKHARVEVKPKTSTQKTHKSSGVF